LVISVVFADFISVAISVHRYSSDGRSIRPPWRKISTGGGSGTPQRRRMLALVHQHPAAADTIRAMHCAETKPT
jgi:hypothetical protein